MINKHHHQLSFILFFLFAVSSFPTPNHKTSFPTPLDVDANIDFSSYPDFIFLEPCLGSFFGGPAESGADNQVAINVQCLANSCLCTPENIEENLSHISSQVSEICTINVDEQIAQATSVLSGYCSIVTAGLTTTTLGGGWPKPTSKLPSKPKPTDQESYPLPDDLEPYLLPDDLKIEEPSGGEKRFGPVSFSAFLGIVITAVGIVIATIIGLCALCYQRDAQRWRNSRP